MGRVKEDLMKQQEEEFELELSYQEWLSNNTQEPTEAEVYDMERDYNNRVMNLLSFNNSDYNPLKGA